MTAPASTESVVARLQEFSRLDGERRVEEQRFVETPAGPLFTTAVTPVGTRRRAAFLTCHSFAWEQFELHPLELTFARAATLEGFPAVSFQARGYGDSGGPFGAVTPSSHIRDAVAAARFAEEGAGGLPVVPVGARLGAMVALATAIEVGAPGVALWDPPERPGRYFHALLRALQVSGVMEEEGADDGPRMGEIKATLSEGGTVDLFGYPLTGACYREAETMDLLAAPAHVPPRTLVLVINPASRGPAGRLAARLRELGSDVRVEEVDGPGRQEFGMGIPRAGHLATHLATFQDMAGRTVRWAEEAW